MVGASWQWAIQAWAGEADLRAPPIEGKAGSLGGSEQLESTWESLEKSTGSDAFAAGREGW